MTTTAVETPEKLVAEYQQTGSTLAFRAIYDYLQGYNELTYLTFRQILPESMLDRGELRAFVDDSIIQSLKSYNDAESQVGFLGHFLLTVSQTAEAAKRCLTMKVCSLSDIHIYKTANQLQESAVKLWQKQWRMTADELFQFKAEVQSVMAVYDCYSKSSPLHQRWAKLLAWESTEFLGIPAGISVDQQELQEARQSFREFYGNKQLEEAITAFQSGKLSAFSTIMNHRELAEERKAMQEHLSDPLFQCYEHEPLTAGEIDAVLDASLLDALETWQKGQRVADSFSTFVLCKWQVIGYQKETEGKLQNTLANCMHRMGLPADTLEAFSKSSKKASAYYNVLAIDLLTALETADFKESLQDYSQYLPNRVEPAAWRAFRSYCKDNALNVAHFPQV